MTEEELITFLQKEGISFQRFEHAPVYTCEQSAALLPDIPGIGTKNLLLTDERKEKYYFLMVLDCKKVDLKILGKTLGAGKLSFASAEMLAQLLGLEPGSVTVFGLAKDVSGKVEVIIDRALWEADEIHCHPLVNTATLVVPVGGVQKFIELSGHSYRLMEIPEKGGPTGATSCAVSVRPASG